MEKQPLLAFNVHEDYFWKDGQNPFKREAVIKMLQEYICLHGFSVSTFPCRLKSKSKKGGKNGN